VTVLSEGKRKARKQHRCEGFDQIDRTVGWHEPGVTKDNLPPMPHAIRPGETYFYQVSSRHGDFGTFKSCEHCWKLIVDHQIYDED